METEDIEFDDHNLKTQETPTIILPPNFQLNSSGNQIKLVKLLDDPLRIRDSLGYDEPSITIPNLRLKPIEEPKINKRLIGTQYTKYKVDHNLNANQQYNHDEMNSTLAELWEKYYQSIEPDHTKFLTLAHFNHHSLNTADGFCTPRSMNNPSLMKSIKSRFHRMGVGTEQNLDETDASGNAPEPQPRNIYNIIQRLNVGLLFRLLLLLFLLEAQIGMYFLAVIGYVIYISGIPHKIWDWIETRWTFTGMTMEELLNQLRIEHRESNEVPVISNVTRPNNNESRENTDNVEPTTDHIVGIATSSVRPQTTPTPSVSNPSLVPENDNSTPMEIPPPYWQCFLYQTVVFFVMSVFPNWNPNPRYVIHYRKCD